MPHTLASDGASLYYQVHGGGPRRLLLLHGMGTSDIWRPLLGHLDLDLYTIVTCDLRGHGQSGGGPHGFTFQQIHEDIAAVLNAAGIDACVAVGFSGSCKNVAWLAVHAIRRVLGLVLVAPSGFGEIPLPRATMAYFGDYLHTQRTIPPEFEPWLTARIGSERQPLIQTLISLPREVMAAATELWVYTSITEVARKVTQPVAVIVAQEDPIYTMDFQQANTLNTLPSATVYIVESGHFIPAEAPTRVAGIIAEFCEDRVVMF